MYSIGDSVLYGANGVMGIVDIRDEAIGEISRKYYVLKPVCVRTDSFTFVPVDNEALVGMMYPLLTTQEFNATLLRAAEAENCEWLTDNRRRAEMFKKILESGDRCDVLVMMKTIFNAGKIRELDGKKNFLADETVMKRAEKLICSEMSVVLGITEDEAAELVKKQLNIE